MVQIEILDDAVDSLQRQRDNKQEIQRNSSKVVSDGSVVANLAQRCSAEIIQVRWRDIRCRQSMPPQNACTKTLKALIDSHIRLIDACEKIQKFWRVRYGRRKQYHSSKSTRIENNSQNSSVQTGTITFDILSIRQKVISHIEQLSQQLIKTIELEESEVAHILKDIGLIGVREYDAILNAHSIKKQRHNLFKTNRKKHVIRLASLNEFRKDLSGAWCEITEFMHQYFPNSKSTLPSRKKYTLNSAESTRARDSVIELVSLPKEFVYYLNENQQIRHYSKSQIESALSIFGDKCHTAKIHGDYEWTLIDHIQNCFHQSQTPWDRIRFFVAYQLVRRVARWEDFLDKNKCYESLDELHLKLHLTKLEASELMDEVVSLREKSKSELFKNAADDKTQTIATDRMFYSVDHESVNNSTLIPDQIRKNDLHKEFKTDSQKKSCAKLNRVDIKFEADPNELSSKKRIKPKLVSGGKVASKFTAIQKKKKSDIHSSSKTASQNTVEKPRDRRTHVFRTAATSTYGEELEKDYCEADRQNDCCFPPQRTYESKSPDSINNTKRFNDILEKLCLHE